MWGSLGSPQCQNIHLFTETSVTTKAVLIRKTRRHLWVTRRVLGEDIALCMGTARKVLLLSLHRCYSTCVCQAGIPHTLQDLSHCSLPSTGAKLEGKPASQFTLSLERSLVATLMWLFSVWNRKLVLQVAEVLEDGFENKTIFLFVALVPASPA